MRRVLDSGDSYDEVANCWTAKRKSSRCATRNPYNT